ncbi:MAG TPA: PQQ-binding-like beta-propeller repeat protein [Kofleriaceae bacterium]
MRGWWIIAVIGCRHGFDGVDPAQTDAPTDDVDIEHVDLCGDGDGLAPNAPWPLIHGCRTNAGRSPYLGPESRASSLGPVSMDAGWTGIVIDAGDRALFSVYNPGTASAFDLVTGEKKFGVPAPGALPWLALGAQQDVYVGSDHGVFYCFDAISGAERWRKQIGGSLQAPMLALGNVYFGTETYGVWAVDTTTRAEKWHFDVPGGGRVAALAFAAGRLYFVDTLASYLYALDAASGEQVFAVPITGGPLGSPVVGIDTVYVATTTRGIAAFDLSSGELRWQQPEAGAAVVQPALLANGDLVTTSSGGLAQVIDRATGAVRRSFAVGGTVSRPPVVAADDTTHFSTSAGIIAVDPANGNVVWQSAFRGQFALGDRTMVVVPVEGQFAVIGR